MQGHRGPALSRRSIHLTTPLQEGPATWYEEGERVGSWGPRGVAVEGNKIDK
jgi:hypothetical protein